jgi:hypothetical protein
VGGLSACGAFNRGADFLQDWRVTPTRWCRGFTGRRCRRPQPFSRSSPHPPP